MEGDNNKKLSGDDVKSSPPNDSKILQVVGNSDQPEKNKSTMAEVAKKVAQVDTREMLKAINKVPLKKKYKALVEDPNRNVQLFDNLNNKTLKFKQVQVCPAYYIKKQNLAPYFELSPEQVTFIAETPLQEFAKFMQEVLIG